MFKVKVMAVVKVTVRAYNIYNQNMTVSAISSEPILLQLNLA